MSSNNNTKDKLEPKIRIEDEEIDEEKKSLIKVEPASTHLDFNQRNSNDEENDIIVEVTKTNMAIPNKHQRSTAK